MNLLIDWEISDDLSQLSQDNLDGTLSNDSGIERSFSSISTQSNGESRHIKWSQSETDQLKQILNQITFKNYTNVKINDQFPSKTAQQISNKKQKIFDQIQNEFKQKAKYVCQEAFDIIEIAVKYLDAQYQIKYNLDDIFNLQKSQQSFLRQLTNIYENYSYVNMVALFLYERDKYVYSFVRNNENNHWFQTSTIAFLHQNINSFIEFMVSSASFQSQLY